METAQAQPTTAQPTDQDFLHRKALAVVGRCAARHFARREKLKVQRPDAGVWPVLHNGLYRLLAEANKESDFSTELLAGSDMSRPGITATAVLASLYSVTSSQLESAKQYHGHPDNIAEYQKLLDILAPLVAGMKPRQESLQYTAAQTAKYHEQPPPRGRRTGRPRLLPFPIATMKIYTDRITPQERQDLAALATGLRGIAGHALTAQLAATLDSWASAPAGRELDTATLDQSAEQVTAAWQKMRGAEQKQHRAEFHAASECRYAARGAGMRAPLSFSDNVADATRALSAARQ